MFQLNLRPSQWCSGRAFAPGAGSCGFDLLPGHTKALKLVVMAALLGDQGFAGLALRLTGWCQDKYISSTGNLHRERRDITGTLLKAAYKYKH